MPSFRKDSITANWESLWWHYTRILKSLFLKLGPRKWNSCTNIATYSAIVCDHRSSNFSIISYWTTKAKNRVFVYQFLAKVTVLCLCILRSIHMKFFNKRKASGTKGKLCLRKMSWVSVINLSRCNWQGIILSLLPIEPRVQNILVHQYASNKIHNLKVKDSDKEWQNRYENPSNKN